MFLDRRIKHIVTRGAGGCVKKAFFQAAEALTAYLRSVGRFKMKSRWRLVRFDLGNMRSRSGLIIEFPFCALVVVIL
jgi:hypothetical protein